MAHTLRSNALEARFNSDTFQMVSLENHITGETVNLLPETDLRLELEEEVLDVRPV